MLSDFSKSDGRGIWRLWGRKEKCTGCWWKNLKERCNWEDPEVDVRIIVRWIFRKLEGWVDWVGLAQDRDRWRELVSTVKNLRVL
jgi:hypothetical protein